MTPEEETTEWTRRRQLPGVVVRHMHTKRSNTVVLMRGGEEIGAKTELIVRGKLTRTMFVLPVIEKKER